MICKRFVYILLQMGKDYVLREYTSRESQVSELEVSVHFVICMSAGVSIGCIGNVV